MADLNPDDVLASVETLIAADHARYFEDPRGILLLKVETAIIEAKRLAARLELRWPSGHDSGRRWHNDDFDQERRRRRGLRTRTVRARAGSDGVTLLPAVLAARLLGADVVDVEYLARLGLLRFEQRGYRNGGLLISPRLRPEAV